MTSNQIQCHGDMGFDVIHFFLLNAGQRCPHWLRAGQYSLRALHGCTLRLYGCIQPLHNFCCCCRVACTLRALVAQLRLHGCMGVARSCVTVARWHFVVVNERAQRGSAPFTFWFSKVDSSQTCKNGHRGKYVALIPLWIWQLPGVICNQGCIKKVTLATPPP